MDAPKKTPAKNYLKLSPQEQAAVDRRKAKAEANKLTITREDLAIAEIADNLGWGAVKDVIDDNYPVDDIAKLARIVKELRKERVQDMALAFAAGRSTKKSTFEKLMKPFMSQMKIT